MFTLPPHLSNGVAARKEEKPEATLEELEKEIPQKADMSIFKAIFEDNSEDEDED